MESVIPYSTIAALVEQYAANCETIKRAAGELAAVESSLAVLGKYRNDLAPGKGIPRADDMLAQMRLNYWRAIVEKSQVKKAMSLKAKAELDAMLSDRHGHGGHAKPLPEITAGNVLQTLAGWAGNRQELMRDQCVEVLQYLMPGTWQQKYKTNQANAGALAKKVIKTGVIVKSYGPGCTVSYHYRDQIDAVDIVFHHLDGQGAPERVDSLSELIARASRTGADSMDTKYFRLKWFYGVGTLHIEFLRPDLVKELNRLAAGGMIAAAH